MSNGVSVAPDLWRAAVENSALAVIGADALGRITLANAAATELFGSAPVGRRLSELFPEFSFEAGLPARAFSFGEALRASDGALRSVEGTASVSDAGLLLTFVEGSERQRLRQAAERASNELQEFAYIVSHDLNAPLRSVKSFVELLERRCAGVLDQDARDYLGFIAGGAKEMESMLNAVLAYSQAGRADKTRAQDTDATGMLQWALMNVDAMVKETAANITWDPLPHVWVDQAQLAQVFQHLLTNAMKFRSEQPPKIHVSASPLVDGMVEFSVSDNGTGIEPDQHQRVFGVFRRLVGKEVPGTGIGLPICRKIAEAQGGRMWVESEPGKGSTFRFTLPSP